MRSRERIERSENLLYRPTLSRYWNQRDLNLPSIADLADTARLECRDGCAIALARCQPGYKCTQTQMYMEGGVEKYTEGYMNICPPGTYRDVSYDQVEECFDCPQGRYREDEKGRYMESCSQCPVGKYVNDTGSESILKCLRCPAGR